MSSWRTGQSSPGSASVSPPDWGCEVIWWKRMPRSEPTEQNRNEQDSAQPQAPTDHGQSLLSYLESRPGSRLLRVTLRDGTVILPGGKVIHPTKM